MNYRLNIFGYLALPELSAVDPRGVSGNYGITDQQLTLRWVQQNIRAFGGNPRQVTIFGHSSGGSNVLAHLASASSKGLFHSAIVISGSANLSMSREAKEAQDQKLILPDISCPDNTSLLSCLHNMSASELFLAMPESYATWAPLFDYPTRHRGIGTVVSALLYVDGVTITHSLQEALRAGLNDVPTLLQGSQAEMDCVPVPQLANLSVNGL